ncbi:MAG: T9SS type A sorting domain-containing protein, partial [Prolixibacteraceae bacterium]
NVTFQVKDEADHSMLSAVNVDIGEQAKTTGIEGVSSFNLNPGIYSVDFSKSDYFGFQSDFEIQSDTIFTVTLKRSHADVKFRLKDGSTPVNDALVVFNGDSLYTSSLGFCIFRSIPVDAEYQFYVEKRFYKKYEGIVSLNNDTTVNIQLAKTVANAEFMLTSEGAIIENPLVLMNGDTAWFDDNLRAKLYNIPIDAQYDFQIMSGNFSIYSDMLWLKNDTTLNISLVYSSFGKFAEETFNIYPNPVKNRLQIITSAADFKVEIIDQTGKIIKQHFLNSEKAELDLSDLKQGFYVIRIVHDDSKIPEVQKIVIQR